MRVDWRIACTLAIAPILLAGCNRGTASVVTGGDPLRGAAAISHYGCGSCHSIEGIPGAHGLVGPPLCSLGKRVYIAGMLANTPDNLERWVRHPTKINEKTLMPDVGVTSGDATDIAAYLYSLK
jgi:cytochrome c2